MDRRMLLLVVVLGMLQGLLECTDNRGSGVEMTSRPGDAHTRGFYETAALPPEMITDTEYMIPETQQSLRHRMDVETTTVHLPASPSELEQSLNTIKQPQNLFDFDTKIKQLLRDGARLNYESDLKGLLEAYNYQYCRMLYYVSKKLIVSSVKPGPDVQERLYNDQTTLTVLSGLLETKWYESLDGEGLAYVHGFFSRATEDHVLDFLATLHSRGIRPAISLATSTIPMFVASEICGDTATNVYLYNFLISRDGNIKEPPPLPALENIWNYFPRTNRQMQPQTSNRRKATGKFKGFLLSFEHWMKMVHAESLSEVPLALAQLKRIDAALLTPEHPILALLSRKDAVQTGSLTTGSVFVSETLRVGSSSLTLLPATIVRFLDANLSCYAPFSPLSCVYQLFHNSFVASDWSVEFVSFLMDNYPSTAVPSEPPDFCLPGWDSPSEYVVSPDIVDFHRYLTEWTSSYNARSLFFFLCSYSRFSRLEPGLKKRIFLSGKSNAAHIYSDLTFQDLQIVLEEFSVVDFQDFESLLAWFYSQTSFLLGCNQTDLASKPTSILLNSFIYSYQASHSSSDPRLLARFNRLFEFVDSSEISYGLDFQPADASLKLTIFLFAGSSQPEIYASITHSDMLQILDPVSSDAQIALAYDLQEDLFTHGLTISSDPPPALKFTKASIQKFSSNPKHRFKYSFLQAISPVLPKQY